MVKCNLCGNKIETTFLGKLLGTKVGDRYLCSNCQSKHGNDIKK